ncbi:MAG: flippase activity-associated protein Agl23 [Haloarculaceae archaeon]
MATADEDPLARALTTLDEVLDRVGIDRVELAVFNVTLVALVARLYALGRRTAHWDEARVAYWILEYMQTGNYEYRPIIHGPFYHHVNKYLFEILGASDATMRLAVALVCGLLPLTALLLRTRLRGDEAVAVSLFLAFNPVLLYYSRFMRGDPLVGAFMFAAFAFFVRSVDTGERRYFYPAVALVALALTAKENALVYLVTWIGAAALLLDHRLFLARSGPTRWTGVLADELRRVGRTVVDWIVPLVLAPVEFLAIVVFFYAPRAATEEGPGLWKAFGQPAMFEDVIYAGSVGAWEDFYSTWIGSGHQDHAYLPYLGDLLATMSHGAVAVSVFAVLGFLVDRYTGDRPNDVVSFAFYWGFVSILGYPIITDIKAPWAAIHAVVALTIPAGVGVAMIYRWAKVAYADDELVDVGLAAVVLVIVAGQVAGAAVTGVYLHAQSGDNDLVQYAQPGDHVGSLVAAMDDAAMANAGTDVLMYGDYYVDGATEATREPACVKWFNSLPLPWYFRLTDATVDCASDHKAFEKAVGQSAPPIIIARTPKKSELIADLDGYRWRYYSFRAWGTNSTVFVRDRWADEMGIPASHRAGHPASTNRTADAGPAETPTVAGTADT